jgi:hypothetical protein
MRDLSKVITGSMIAGAALLVAACGGGSEANNTAADNGLGTDVFNEVPADNGGAGLNGTDSLGGNGSVSNELSNAANSVSNAQEAVNGTNNQ